jgi:hypothetical protein
MRRWLAETMLPRRAARVERRRVRLPDGAATTLHVAAYASSAHAPRVVRFDEPVPLVRWCREHDVAHAVVGGFFLRPGYDPLGELHIGGNRAASVAFTSPWDTARGCLQIDDAGVRIAPRDELAAAPAGDLLQAGPVLVRDGRRAVATEDPEGFASGAHQFDSDITDGRYPRAAIAVAGDRLLTVACDGRTRRDAGMTLGELADVLVGLGADEALNLDGGGSASLVHDGRLRNRPREQHGVDLLEGRPVVTAVVLEPVSDAV